MIVGATSLCVMVTHSVRLHATVTQLILVNLFTCTDPSFERHKHSPVVITYTSLSSSCGGNVNGDGTAYAPERVPGAPRNHCTSHAHARPHSVFRLYRDDDLCVLFISEQHRTEQNRTSCERTCTNVRVVKTNRPVKCVSVNMHGVCPTPPTHPPPRIVK